MKNPSLVKKIIAPFSIVVLVAILLFCPVAKAENIEFVDEEYNIQDFEGQIVRVLCQYQQVTGSMWHAMYIELDDGKFAKLNPGTDISISSFGQPQLSGEYTSSSYGKTKAIIKGRFADIDPKTGELKMKISSWTVSCPIDLGWYHRTGYLKNHIIVLDLLLARL